MKPVQREDRRAYWAELTAHGCRGATILEYALIFPVLIFIILGIVDVGRFFAVQALVNAGANDGVNLARVVPNLDVDYRGMTTASKRYVRYRTAREMVDQLARSIPLNTLVSDINVPSTAKMSAVTMVDNGLSLAADEAPPDFEGRAAILRPGECADIDGYGQFCNRQTLGISNADDAPVTSPRYMMKRHPIQVVMMVRFHTFLPFFPEFNVLGVASGFREEVPEAAFPGEDDPMDNGEDTVVPGEEDDDETFAAPPDESPTPAATCLVDWSFCAQKSASEIPPLPRVPDPGVIDPLSAPRCACVRLIAFSPET